MSKAVGLIPARWGSTRFPGKPLHLIAGKPLLQHVWERCQRAKSLDSVVIATDDMRIAEAAFAWGAEVSLTKSDHASGTDRIAEVARKMRGVSPVVNIQGDEPLIDFRLIDRLVRQMERDPEIAMITAAHPFEDPADATSPHQVKTVLDRHGHALYFSLRSLGAFALGTGRGPRAIARLGEWRKDPRGRDQKRLPRSGHAGRGPGDRTSLPLPRCDRACR